MSLYLATKEMQRNKVRFGVVILIVALITLLVIFAALGDGLADGAKEYIENVDAELYVMRDDVEFSVAASRLGPAKLNDLNRIDGIQAVGPLGFSTASIVLNGIEGLDKLDVTLIGVEPGSPGSPSVVAGTALADERAEEVVIGQNVLERVNLPLGSTITLRVVQGVDERFYNLTVVGHTQGQKFNFLPSIFVPLRIWDRVKPQERPGGGDMIFNIAAVKLADPAATALMMDTIRRTVNRVDVTDPVMAYESSQGYRDMQSIIGTQQNFVLLIVLLIIGGFFQIQALQKVVQTGMLKAIGASNRLVSVTLLLQVIATTIAGLIIGGAGVLGLASIMPATIPLVFSGQKIVTTIITLLVIGPLAGLVSIRTLLKVEPLKALGLGV